MKDEEHNAETWELGWEVIHHSFIFFGPERVIVAIVTTNGDPINTFLLVIQQGLLWWVFLGDMQRYENQ